MQSVLSEVQFDACNYGPAQKGTAQMFVHPPTTTLELKNDREYKIQMETC